MSDDKDVVTINISASSRISNEDLKIFTTNKTSRIVINDGAILHDAVLTASSYTALGKKKKRKENDKKTKTKQKRSEWREEKNKKKQR